jgi:hypothetical protein
LTNYLLDNLDVPEILNYLAAVTVTHQNDHPHKNYYLYRDTEGSGEWQMFPQDIDLSFGKNYIGDMGGVLSDVMYADDDSIPGRAAEIKPSHPFIGAENYREWNNNWNRLIDAIFDSPVLRDVYLRRLRTVMDELLQAPGTPAEELLFEQRIDELAASIAPEAAMYLGGTTAWPWGTNQSLAQAVNILKTQYLAVRRTHLYNTHSIDNGLVSHTLVDHPAAALAFVPTASLGTTWTTRTFDDSAWTAGTQGVGYERATGYESLIGLNVDALMDPDNNDVNNNNTAYIRIHFNVDNPAVYQNLFLDMKYDDGFVAHLNGTRVSFSNALPTAAWNSSALSDRADSAALTYQTFNISTFLPQLVAGDNVLAIQGLNFGTSGASASDFLIDARLRATAGYAETAGIPHAQVGNPEINFGAVEYNPASGNQDEEYIQLTNPNATAVDISGWKLQGGVEHTFRKGTVIPANGSLYVSPKVEVFRARATGPSGGQGLFVQGNYDGHISNLGELIELVAPDTTIVSSITTPATPSDAQQFLRVTEVMYNPGAPNNAEISFGFTDNDDFEFVELQNISETTTLDLTDVQFSQGIDFMFAPGTMLTPGQRVLVVKSAAAMNARYGPGLNIAGEFANLTALSNGGESIRLDDADNSTIFDVTFDDAAPWYPSTDGAGASLVLIDPATPVGLLSDPLKWRASLELGGAPGAVDPTLGGKVFDDTNGDGIYGPGETEFSGVVVTLYDAGPDGQRGGGDDTLLDTATTDDGGRYRFLAHLDRTYYLHFAAPSGYVFSPQDEGLDDALDSDVDTDGFTAAFLLPANQADNTRDAGIVAAPSASIVERLVFYNQSFFDGNNAAATTGDDAAIDTTKQALLPGQTGSFLHYTGYSRGLNGIMVDLSGPHGTITAADFGFKVGNNNTPGSWGAAPAPTSVTLRAGAGIGGSDRYTLIWPNNAIQKTWLQVTVLANGNTNLPADDVFYFGNAVGEVGNSSANAIVTAADESLIRLNFTTGFGTVPVTSPYDIDKNRFVQVSDAALSRANQTTAFSALRLIAPPPGAGGGGSASSADPALTSLDSNLIDLLANSRRRRR